jgi:hypothetical protein
MLFSRRSAIELALALWAKAEEQAHQHGAPGPSSGPYQMKFLSPVEVTTIQRFGGVMIPAGERSGGAKAAQVETYIDHTLASAAPSLQRSWRAGLAQWAKEKDTEGTLAKVAANEFAPKTKEDQFFVLFKTALTAAFYTSQEGILKELGYQGMGYVREFAGYQGEAFVVPAGYKPMLRRRS